MSLTNTQKEHLRWLCAQAVNSLDWAEELAEAQIPDTPELWEYLRAIERRISKALGEPSPTLY